MEDISRLQLEAEEAAANFTLPPDWPLGRASMSGLAIGGDERRADQDTFGYDFDSQKLVVSFTDSSLLGKGPIERYARRMYVEDNVARGLRLHPMVSPVISERGLDFAEGEDRPAITVQIPLPGTDEGATVVKSIIKAQHLDVENTGRLLHKGMGETPNTLRAINMVAGKLAGEVRYSSQNRQKRRSPKSYIMAGSLLVGNCISVANSAVADFMNDNDIPAIYLNRLWSEAGKEFYSTESLGHSRLDVHNYARINSPLSQLQAFINQANLSAFLDGRDCPYPEYELDVMAADINSYYNLSPLLSYSKRLTGYLREKFLDNTAQGKDLARAIFAAVGTTKEVNEVRQLALRKIESNPSMATTVINYAISKGHLTARPTKPADKAETETVIEDRDGNVYPTPMGYGWIKHHKGIDLLGSICDLAVYKEMPEDHQEKIDNILGKGSYRFLNNMSRGRKVRLRMNTMQEEDGTIVMDVYLRGELHRRRFKGGNRSQSVLGAARLHILDHDLINNRPQVLSEPTLQYSPAKALREWQDYTGADPVEFVTTQGGDGAMICKATLRTPEGDVYEATGIGFDLKAGQAAKRSAAAFLLQQLPPGPYPKRGSSTAENSAESA